MNLDKIFKPFQLQDTSTLTPDHPDFRKLDINVAILTKYGRGVYIRHGNQDRCSSFFATIGTIVNKLEISFGRGQQRPAQMKCIKQGDIQVYVLRRLNFMYVCWSKSTIAEVTLYGMLEFMHHQLLSCLTGQVNSILDTNQTYDPSVNFGKSRTEHMLLHYAFNNGLQSLPITFNAIPVMPLPSSVRSTIYGLLKDEQIEGLQINILMTMNEVIHLHKQKGIDLTVYDIFLFNTLIQSQSSLRSEIWYPICMPGVILDSRVFCYISFLSDHVIHIMVSDEASIFPDLSKASKALRERLVQQNIFEKVHTAAQKNIIEDPTLERMGQVKHFMFRFSNGDENSLPQMAMSSGNYFGRNSPQFQKYIPIYSELQKQLATRRQGKKQKIQIQQLGNDFMGGYQQEGGLSIFFICSYLCDIDQCRNILSSLARYIKQQESNLYIPKFV